MVKKLQKVAKALGKAPPVGDPFAAVAVGTFNVLVGSLKAHAALLSTIESRKVYLDKI